MSPLSYSPFPNILLPNEYMCRLLKKLLLHCALTHIHPQCRTTKQLTATTTLVLSFCISCVREIVLLLFPYYYSLSPVPPLLRKIIYEDRIPIPAQQWSCWCRTYCCACMHHMAILVKVDEFFLYFPINQTCTACTHFHPLFFCYSIRVLLWNVLLMAKSAEEKKSHWQKGFFSPELTNKIHP